MTPTQLRDLVVDMLEANPVTCELPLRIVRELQTIAVEFADANGWLTIESPPVADSDNDRCSYINEKGQRCLMFPSHLWLIFHRFEEKGN